MEKCDLAISKWMIDAGVPFNAVNSSYYQPMIDVICSMGPGYKGPNFYRVRGHLLNKWVREVNKLVESYRTVWKQTGCTIMTDGWTDRCRRTLINFLVYCPKGTIFLKSVDASNASKTADLLYKLFRDVVLHVGPENVVQIVTDNAANYVAVGRKYTGGREILRPAPTRFATNFIALQSILAQKDALRAMLTEPLIRVLRIVDSENKPAMGFLYRAIFKAREEMIKRFQRNKKKVEPYLQILDRRWDSQLRKNLHAAGYWLNPGCRYNDEEFEKHKFTTSGLLDVIEKYAYGDPDLNSKLTSEMRIFKNVELDFGSASGCERNWSAFEHIHSNKRNRLEHQKLNDLVYVRYNLRLAQRNRLKNQNYDPINFETFEDHSNWVLEDSPPYLTAEEMETLRNELANMSTQPTLDDNDEAQDNIMENANQTEGNVGQALDLFDEGGEDELIDTTLPPWA
ncbi:uncharacterized protein LOC133305351 [Gastrolobium bilobum]|uniref:uncharacterized protein LOC133305351 n=1 Tax=Gastrolobium bilobum TaxID=150636 RepID=UPI002AB048D6|nr:uncharacterized protein LOC133305351 [Gastrolobium bilobum]